MIDEKDVLQKRKVAMVAGGSRGIGKEIAFSLARMGIGIVLTYHSNETEGDRVAQEIVASGGVAVALRLDLAMSSSFDAFLEQLRALLPDKFGTEEIDFLINNAGFGKAIPIDSLTEPDFDSFVDVHFKGVVFLTQKISRMMNDGGGVVFITRRQIAITSRITPRMVPAKERSRSSLDMWQRNMAPVESGPTQSHRAES